LDTAKNLQGYTIQKAFITEVGEENVDEACRVFIDGLHPYWDWWIEEEGGREMVLRRTAEWLKQTITLAARVNNKIVGVAGIVPHPEWKEASFLGVMVLPKYRFRGIGWTLMKASLNKTKQLGYKRLVVHTMAYMDSLAPGAILYLKSGGKIEAEYLHFLKSQKQA